MADGAFYPSVPVAAVDLAFLDRYTDGDAAIRNQILSLYLEQSRVLFDRLVDAIGDRKGWHDAAHSLKGCARGIGAHTVADVAYKAERATGAGADVEAHLLHDLDVALSSTAEIICDLMKAA